MTFMFCLVTLYMTSEKKIYSFSVNTINFFLSRVMKTLKFSLVLRTRENTDVFITFDDNIYGIHSKRVNILYLLFFLARHQNTSNVCQSLIWN